MTRTKVVAAPKVVAGPAGHWYALWHGGPGSASGKDATLIGRPQMMGEDQPPAYPETVEEILAGGWYEITEYAPGCDDEAIIAELRQ